MRASVCVQRNAALERRTVGEKKLVGRGSFVAAGATGAKVVGLLQRTDQAIRQRERKRQSG